jgi:hypothetical protein
MVDNPDIQPYLSLVPYRCLWYDGYQSKGFGQKDSLGLRPHSVC